MKKLIRFICRQLIFIVVVLPLIFSACKTQETETVLDLEEPYGLVNVSVCNMRPVPAHNTELISQAVMGTPVKILKLKSGWYYIQTPEFYEGWVPSQAIRAMELSKFERWKSSDRIIYTEKYGDIYEDTLARNIISDIVAGSLIRLKKQGPNYYHLALPDGREGYIWKDDAAMFDEWLSETKPREENLKKWAEAHKGIPYLWGGTSSKAFDCSGFIKTVYYLNGLILARDASQQFEQGMKISKEAYPDSLRPGDLLFFGYDNEGNVRPTHVGMYIGDTEFIHASGMVKVNSLDSTRNNFSRGRRNSFLGVRRIIGADQADGLQFVSSHPWYTN
ncbi:MAG: C40 family peptidase [Bacteroidota bacterium]|nr:C40 family peptidase [Bacteroidota bacterium]